ncbi:glutathione S-transferase family protein [Hwanghaeella sp. 1Z406]|uniref:glutathione S-transferase family protein n=1 Tax=Hwanghaeella sp. 1Z406 TaxID=3402811 RepID=UPI003B67443F
MLTIHHLYPSRAERILFLAHELDIEHEVVAYHRDPETRLAPPELKTIHPLGSSPVIVDDGLCIAESGAAVMYLTRKYGGGRLLPEPGSPEAIRCEEWVHFNEATLMAWVVNVMILQMAGAAGTPTHEFATLRVGRYIAYMNDALEGRDFLCGDAMTMADIMTAFSLDFMMNVSMPGLFDFPGMAEATALTAYAERLRAQPGYLYSQRRDF